jgi:glycosyltransferase involved in cell wall biosynthesis
MDVCTIIAKNYVAHARVLARSFAEHNPDGRFWVLVVDDCENYLDADIEPFRLLTPNDIACEPFDRMACRYNVLELCTAVKPWLLRYLLAQDAGAITYLDPDIRIYGSLDRLDELARENRLVLTPHNTKGVPPDGERPTQMDILVAGVYNLGYVSLGAGPETEELLDWWADRLQRDCRVDPIYGYFVDQRWFDLAPGFVSDCAIVRDPEYNLAYWNVYDHDLTGGEELYRVDGRPLRFFHFSGFDPAEPEILSRHQTRVRLSEFPVLNRLCREYATQVLAEGHLETRNWPYTYERLADGSRLTSVLRRLYALAEESGELSDSPFTERGCRRFLEWLEEIPDGAPGELNRALAGIYQARPEVRAAYPDLTGADRDGFVEWVRVSEDPDLALPTVLLPATGSDAPPSLTTSPPGQLSEAWGVNVAGYFRSELGVGEAARQVIKALDSSGVPVLPVHGSTIPPNRQGHAFTHLRPRDARFPINLICINADALSEFAAQTADEGFFRGRYSIGLWFWEVTSFPERWLGAFEFLDEVWVPSQHVAEAVTTVAPVPTVQIRIPVTMSAAAPIARSVLGLPDGFLFLFSFDYHSVFKRKNPLATIEAFTQAFPPGSGASLVVKCINEESDRDNHERLRLAAAEHPDVHVLEGYLSPADKNSLMAACDCYVSLHRSEGFGLTMAEAMYLGKPVVATGYSGNLDFMNGGNSHLVNYELVTIGPRAAPYPAEGEWAEPDVDHAAQLMRTVFDDTSAAAGLGRRAAADIRSTHSAAAAGERMSRRLELIRARRPAVHVTAAPAALDAMPARLARGPLPGPRKTRIPGRGLARRLVLRLMRPFTAFQSTVNRELLESIEGIWQQVAAVDAQVTRSLAQNLAQQRGQQEEIIRAREALPERADGLDAQQRDLDTLRDEVLTLRGALVERVDGLRQDVDGLTIFRDPIIDRLDRLDQAMKQAEAESQTQTDRTLYAAMALLGERHQAISERPNLTAGAGALTPYELRVFSQNGEDGLLAEILARVGVGERFFVEFGVESGREGNCVYLADVAGWRGLFIDCDEHFFVALHHKYRADDRVRTTHAMVTPENVQELFAAGGVPREPDVLSIDVDGCDYWIWKAIDDYCPRVLVIEYNSALDPRRRLVQPADLESGWDGTTYFGASLGAMRALGERKGYRLVHTELCGVNAFFVRADLAEGRFPAVEDVPMRDTPNYFQRGRGHPHDPDKRPYLDLDSGELVSVDCTRDEARAAQNGADTPSEVLLTNDETSPAP